MKKSAVILAVALLMTPLISGTVNNEANTVYAEKVLETKAETSSEDIFFGLRNTNWGMTMKEVKAAEKAKFGGQTTETDSTKYKWKALNYPDTEFCGEEFNLRYDFTSQNKLYGVSYINTSFSDDTINEKFASVKKIMVEKYGKPDTCDENDIMPMILWNDIDGSAIMLIAYYEGSASNEIGIFYNTVKVNDYLESPDDIKWDEDISNGAGVTAYGNPIY